jgi:hypothetical protein
VKRNIPPNNKVKPLCLISIPYVRGVSEKFKCTVNKYNIRTVFKTRHTLRSSLVRTRSISAPQKDHWTYDSGNTIKILKVVWRDLD